jgi:DNA-directed RNA polymerase subunit RPC12/RpoP
MNCWHCGTELIWGGDHDCEDNEEYVMETNLSCPKCKSLVMVYLPEEDRGGVSPLFARCPDGGVSPDGKVYE